jgi:hypothetical protein
METRAKVILKDFFRFAVANMHLVSRVRSQYLLCKALEEYGLV